MTWGAFSYNGVGPIYLIERKIDVLKHVDNVMIRYVEDEMPLVWVMHPKHTLKVAKEWFKYT